MVLAGSREYETFDAMGLAELVRTGRASARELVEAAIARIEQVNPAINAVIADNFTQALERAERVKPEEDGPLAGVPFLLKDLHQPYPGMRATDGTMLLSACRPSGKSTYVERLEAAGLIVCGKTNTPEFGLVGVTESKLFGPCRNPWDLARTSGGSSGGSAAAVASGMVPIAHGSDGGGSIRIPASCCGVFGLKPSRGRNPVGPGPRGGFAGLFAVDHVLSRSVRDSAALLDIAQGVEPWFMFERPGAEGSFLAGLEQAPEGLRIAVFNAPLFNTELDPQCAHAVAECAGLLEELGHRVEPAFPDTVDVAALADAFLDVWCGEAAETLRHAELAAGRRARPRETEIVTAAMALVGQRINAARTSRALAQIQTARFHMSAFHENYDLLVMPSLAAPPLLIGQHQPRAGDAAAVRLFQRVPLAFMLDRIDDSLREQAFRWIGYTPLANMLGAPAMSLPLHWSDADLPIGVQVIAPHGGEALLLRLARQIELARPWLDRRPRAIPAFSEANRASDSTGQGEGGDPGVEAAGRSRLQDAK